MIKKKSIVSNSTPTDGTGNNIPFKYIGAPYLVYPEQLNKTFYTSSYNYRCGKCGGEFSIPSQKDGKFYCPFCGNEMIGL